MVKLHNVHITAPVKASSAYVNLSVSAGVKTDNADYLYFCIKARKFHKFLV